MGNRDDALSALAQETRLEVYRLLVKAGPPDYRRDGSASNWFFSRRIDRRREVPLSTGEEADGSQHDHLFTANGHWVEHPPAWDSPDASFEQKQFFDVLEQCLAGLPRKTAQAFLMREHLGVETDAICAEPGVTANHCNVLLYRARMALQQCLHAHWFAHR